MKMLTHHYKNSVLEKLEAAIYYKPFHREALKGSYLELGIDYWAKLTARNEIAPKTHPID